MPSFKKERTLTPSSAAAKAPPKRVIEALDTDGYLKGRKTRMRIVEAASRQFSTHGYSATSLEQIAVAAGMTKGAVSGHFKRKRDLYVVFICAET